MESVIAYPHSVTGLHPICAFGKSKLGKLGFSLKEIADGSTLQFPILNIKADGERRVRFAQRNPADSGRSINGDDNKTPHQSSEGNTYNKEEILALFRRIQSSISSGQSNASKGRTTNNASADSVLQVLRQSRNQTKGKTSNREASTVSGEWKKDEKKEEIVDLKSTDAQISRPPSNFVKRSPIPSVERVQDDVKSEGLENMKLAALKELAKSRGIKGFSKLKKGELIELLRTV